ncbi:MAG: hypothetical protein J6U79_04275 [Paludibacteraceae bacterium]|jgi:hypothetical protein|nr:hypothetical protein [Paludibacteraceae bacterium]
MSKLNRVYWGFLFGIVFPVLFGCMFLYVLKERNYMNFASVFRQVMGSGQMLFKWFIVSITPNLFSLFVAYKKELWRLCSGFISATLIYFMVAIILM